MFILAENYNKSKLISNLRKWNIFIKIIFFKVCSEIKTKQKIKAIIRAIISKNKDIYILYKK